MARRVVKMLLYVLMFLLALQGGGRRFCAGQFGALLPRACLGRVLIHSTISTIVEDGGCRLELPLGAGFHVGHSFWVWTVVENRSRSLSAGNNRSQPAARNVCYSGALKVEKQKILAFFLFRCEEVCSEHAAVYNILIIID